MYRQNMLPGQQIGTIDQEKINWNDLLLKSWSSSISSRQHKSFRWQRSRFRLSTAIKPSPFYQMNSVTSCAHLRNHNSLIPPPPPSGDMGIRWQHEWKGPFNIPIEILRRSGLPKVIFNLGWIGGRGRTMDAFDWQRQLDGIRRDLRDRLGAACAPNG